MKQSEKLDLILKELYKHKYDGKYHSIADAFLLRKIPINIYVELRSLTQRLKDDGFIKVVFQRDDCFGELTTSGIEYCEKNSYTNEGISLLSVNANPHPHIEINNYDAIKIKITELREVLNNNKEIRVTKRKDILDCIDEVENNIDADKKPKFSFEALYTITIDIEKIIPIVSELGSLIFE